MSFYNFRQLSWLQFCPGPSTFWNQEYIILDLMKNWVLQLWHTYLQYLEKAFHFYFTLTNLLWHYLTINVSTTESGTRFKTLTIGASGVLAKVLKCPQSSMFKWRYIDVKSRAPGSPTSGGGYVWCMMVDSRVPVPALMLSRSDIKY